jgi:PAS domain-containing protein
VLVGGALLSRETTETVAFVVDLTRQRRAEAAQRITEARARLALAAADLGTFDWDLATGTLAWGRALQGDLRPAARRGRQLRRLPRPAAPRRPRAGVAEVVAGVLDPAGAGEYRMEYRVCGPRRGPTRCAGSTPAGTPTSTTTRAAAARCASSARCST